MTTNQHFKTHWEFMRYLLEEEGRRVQNTESGLIAGYLDGELMKLHEAAVRVQTNGR